MKGIFCWLPLLLLLAAVAPALAARTYEIDPETGQTTVLETESSPEEKPDPSEELAGEEQPASCPEDEAEIRRLREIARRQQRILLRQRALISQLREELRRKDDIIRGLDLLRRQGR